MNTNIIKVGTGGRRHMKYKEFVKWCNERACDGAWSIGTAMSCLA
jgi:hypothetical protein